MKTSKLLSHKAARIAMLVATTALVAPIAAMAQTETAPAPEPTKEPEMTVVTVKGKNVPTTMRRTAEVASMITAEDLKRTGDDNAAVVLTRVAGLSLVEGKFVYVRGLGERYSSALLNGSPLPSPEPLQRVVPLDLFPSSILGRVSVQKTYSADYPGEFGGGVIDMKTVAVPRKAFFSFGMGTGGNTEVTGKNAFTHYGSDGDFLGFDDGTRNMPGPLASAVESRQKIGLANYSDEELQKIGQSLVNAPLNLIQESDGLPANFSVNVSGGDKYDVAGGRLGVVGVFDFSNSWSAREGIKQSGQTAGTSFDVYDDFVYGLSTNNVGLNALFSLGYERKGHSVQWTNLFIRKTTKFTSVTEGDDLFAGYYTRSDRTGWYERELKMTQLAGESPLMPNLKLNWAASYAETTRDAPYENEVNYRLDDNELSPGYGYFYVKTDGLATTSFSYLTDTVKNINASLTYDFSLGEGRDGKIVGGVDKLDNERNYKNYDFRYTGTLLLPETYERVDFLLSDANIGPSRLHIEQLDTSQAYDATLTVDSAFIKADVAVLPLVRVAGGVRYEKGKETIALHPVYETTAAVSPEAVIENDYFLPSITATWNFKDDMQARLGASKTIGRPQFREMAEPTYYDVDSNRAYIGNSNLKDTEIENFDARYEWYYGSGAYITAGAFYKTLTNPVEQVFGKDRATYTYVNAPKADLYGFELDYKGIFTAPWKSAFFANKSWVVMANYTNTKSEVKFSGSDTVTYANIYNQNLNADLVFRKGTKLQGQSDHLANVQFGWDDEEAKSQATILVTYVSERISARVSASDPDIIQEPGTNVDFVYRKKVDAFGRPFNFSLEARNITGNEYKEYQEQGNRVYIDNYKPGSSVSLSISTEF